jgi:hypothetical protein
MNTNEHEPERFGRCASGFVSARHNGRGLAKRLSSLVLIRVYSWLKNMVTV